MSYGPAQSHPRASSGTMYGAPAQQHSQSPALVQRISEKKQELENLVQLRDLSAALAQQMELLEEKLGTLADGTQGEQRPASLPHAGRPI